MPKYASADHWMVEEVAWKPEAEAERVNDHILLSRGTSSAYVVTSPDGDVIINAGTPYQGERHRERFEKLLGRRLDVRKMVFTQSHHDVMGGWGAFNDAGADIVVQRQFPLIRQERMMLTEFFYPRRRIVNGLNANNPAHHQSWRKPSTEFAPTTLFDQSHEFMVGGRRFELYSTPAGETLDSIHVWLPDERTLFTGNWAGALYGALPHFYTLRGDRDRSVPQFLRDLDQAIARKPALLLTGHGPPIVGEGRIAADFGRIREAVAHIHDETVRGMSQGKDLYSLMREIELPAHLDMAPGRGPVRWYVRAVWEEYTGWFRHESTTEIYATPASAIWGELAQMAGGPDALAQAAQRHVDAGRPVEALHFTDMARAVDPKHKGVLTAELGALEQLIAATGGRTYDELAWLEGEVARATADLGEA